jgi:hypothetical protein
MIDNTENLCYYLFDTLIYIIKDFFIMIHTRVRPQGKCTRPRTSLALDSLESARPGDIPRSNRWDAEHPQLNDSTHSEQNTHSGHEITSKQNTLKKLVGVIAITSSLLGVAVLSTKNTNNTDPKLPSVTSVDDFKPSFDHTPIPSVISLDPSCEAIEPGTTLIPPAQRVTVKATISQNGFPTISHVVNAAEKCLGINSPTADSLTSQMTLQVTNRGENIRTLKPGVVVSGSIEGGITG